MAMSREAWLAPASMLEAYAVERARRLECGAFLAENGMVRVLRNDKGEVRAVQEAPQLRIAQRAREAAIKLGVQLELHLSSD